MVAVATERERAPSPSGLLVAVEPESEPLPTGGDAPTWSDGLPSLLEDGDPAGGAVGVPGADGSTLVIDGIRLRRVYTVQVGVYREREYAHAMTDLLRRRGYDPTTITALTERGDLLRHVRIADYDDEASAFAAAAEFTDRENLAAAVVATRHARQ
jgi:hypothetical protein